MKRSTPRWKADQVRKVIAWIVRVFAVLLYVIVMGWGTGNPLEPWKGSDAEGKAILTGFLIFIECSIWYYRRSTQKVENPFHCQKCGYNLTGNRSGSCPECGEPIINESSETR